MSVMDEGVSIIVPVFNERPVIEMVIRDLVEHVANVVPASEIIVVDDCSTDGTSSVLLKLASNEPSLRVIRSERNRGHGPALMTGLTAATQPWLFLVDADGQIPARSFMDLWGRRFAADVIMGRRDVRRDPRHRVFLSHVLERIVGRVARRAIADPNVPCKLVRRDVWLDVRPHMKATARIPSVLIAAGAALRGWRVESVSVDHVPRPHGRSKLHAGRLVHLGSRAVLDLLSFRRRVKRAAPRRPNDRQPEAPRATFTK